RGATQEGWVGAVCKAGSRQADGTETRSPTRRRPEAAGQFAGGFSFCCPRLRAGPARQWQSPLLSRRLAITSRSNSGRIAQLVEQLTLNQRVQGSSPCAPTIEINSLARSQKSNKNSVHTSMHT